MTDGGRGAVTLRTFGATTVSGPDGEALAGLGAKAMGVLVLAAETAPTPVTRDRLVDQLWQRVAPAQGKGSLRQELRRFKKVLGDELFSALFDVTDAHVAVRPAAIDYDAARLERLAALEDAEALAEIIDLYKGEFLADNTARADHFQDWAVERRSYYEDLAVTALTRLADLDLAAGRLERCQQAADLVIRIDPLQEDAQEILIRRHIADGRRGQARSAFEMFRARLLREIGAEPAVELAALVSGEAEMRRPLRAAQAETGARPTISVLNVSRPSGDEQGYLAAGMVEELVANLSRSRWIRVAPLNAPFMPRERVEIAQRDLRDDGDYVLRVNVQAAAARVSVQAAMTRVEDNAQVFTDTLHGPAEDPLAVQREAAIRIASVFEDQAIRDQGERLRDVDWGAPVDLDHWRTLMRARWLFWKTGPNANAEALRLLGEAARMNPQDAETFCMIAFANMVDGWCGFVDDPGAAFDAARHAAERAIKIAPDNAWAHFAAGSATTRIGSLSAAEACMRRALQLSPALVCATGELARIRFFRGDLEAALLLAEEATALSPYDPHYGLWVRTKALVRWQEGALDEALELIEFAEVVRRGWFHNRVTRAAILSDMGRTDEAAEDLAAASAMIGGYGDAAFRLGHPFETPEILARFTGALNRAGGAFRPD